MRLKEKVAVVTGASQGIGAAIALGLAKEGAIVAVNFKRSVEGAERVVKDIRVAGGRAMTVRADVTEYAQVEMMIDRVRQELGDVDILVNNAGGKPHEVKTGVKPFHERTEKDWDAYVALNLKSVFNCCRVVIGRMVARRSGRIVNIASAAGVIGSAGAADYSAAKAGVIGLTKALAKDVAPYGVNVNSISPGFIMTAAAASSLSAARRDEQLKMSGLPWLGRPEDIASLVVFLASEEARFITGQDYAVGGLRTLGGLV